MQIVIEIPEEDYINIKNAINSLIENGCERASISKVCLAILNGTPLPKGHGRIIDEDKIGEFRIGSMCKFMTNAPTIIEGSDSE